MQSSCVISCGRIHVLDIFSLSRMFTPVVVQQIVFSQVSLNQQPVCSHLLEDPSGFDIHILNNSFGEPPTIDDQMR